MGNILCTYHADTRPSMTVYPDGWAHCWVCGAHVHIGEKNVKLHKKDPTDIESELARIRDLPVEWFRGLRLHKSHQGAYIIWPNVPFFKRRNAQGQVRYTAPTGVKPPIFLYAGNEHLVVIEGELNCMSVKSAYEGPETICSPGAASQFPKFIQLYKTYSSVTLILDKDAAGVAYGQETKETLLKLGKHCNAVYLDRDYNDILVQDGPEALERSFKGDL